MNVVTHFSHLVVRSFAIIKSKSLSFSHRKTTDECIFHFGIDILHESNENFLREYFTNRSVPPSLAFLSISYFLNSTRCARIPFRLLAFASSSISVSSKMKSVDCCAYFLRHLSTVLGFVRSLRSHSIADDDEHQNISYFFYTVFSVAFFCLSFDWREVKKMFRSTCSFDVSQFIILCGAWG